jgi:hypothetical protein
LYHSLWNAIRIIANGSGAIILIALQRVGTVLQEYYYKTAGLEAEAGGHKRTRKLICESQIYYKKPLLFKSYSLA